MISYTVNKIMMSIRVCWTTSTLSWSQCKNVDIQSLLFKVTFEVSHHMNIWKLIAHISYFSKHTETVKNQISINSRIFRENAHQSRRSHSKRSLTVSEEWNWRVRWSLFNTLYTRACWTMRNLKQRTTKKKVRLEIFDSARLERKKKFTATQQHTSRLISSFIHRFTFEVECYHFIYVAWTEEVIESLSFIFRSHRERAFWNESKAWKSCQLVNDKRDLKVIASEHLKRKRENQISVCVNEICSFSLLFRAAIATSRWAIDFSFCSFKIFYHRLESQFTDFSQDILSSFRISVHRQRAREIAREIRFVRAWIIRRNRTRTRDVDLRLTTIAWPASWITYKRRVSIARKEDPILEFKIWSRGCTLTRRSMTCHVCDLCSVTLHGVDDTLLYPVCCTRTGFHSYELRCYLSCESQSIIKSAWRQIEKSFFKYIKWLMWASTLPPIWQHLGCASPIVTMHIT